MPVSFFSLQDIIISVTGVLIIVLLLLALDLDSSVRDSFRESITRDELKAKLAALIEQIARARQEATSEEESILVPADRLKALEAELQDLKEAKKNREDFLASIEGSQEAQLTREQIEVTLEQAKAKAAEAQEIEAAAESAEEQLKKATDSLRQVEARVLEMQNMSNQLWLIPESATTTKEPVLVIVSKDELKMARLSRPGEERLESTSNLLKSIDTLLDGLSPATHYVVFFFRPSGITHFARITDAAKGNGYEIGYDAVEEDFVVSFASKEGGG